MFARIFLLCCIHSRKLNLFFWRTGIFIFLNHSGSRCPRHFLCLLFWLQMFLSALFAAPFIAIFLYCISIRRLLLLCASFLSCVLSFLKKIESGCNGIFGIPLEAKEVTKDILKQSFPTDDVLAKWHKGEDAEWPPVQMPTEMPPLRFSVGTKVLCRVGPNPETGWAPGVIDKLWYRETNWPPASFAPYKIILDDGRNIFAPADRDEVIKKQQ